MKTILTGGHIVAPSGIIEGDIVIAPPFIENVGRGYVASASDRVIDVHGAFIMPGVIDTHVHFRQPGMTHKATIATESRAAAAGGVTSVCEMPNCKPLTTSSEALAEKQAIAGEDSAVNFAFFIGATHDNADVLRKADYTTVPGIKVFMGSSTGGMLVDDADALRSVFSISPHIPVVTHCEDTDIINKNARIYGDSSDISLHPLIRSREACIASTRLAVRIAKECRTRLHVAHISTREEIEIVRRAGFTAEACIPHLFFTDKDYARLGVRIKCNPAIKTQEDRDALRRALIDGSIATVATDHAPHLLAEKLSGGCISAPSGMPMVQFSLPTMLTMGFGYETVARLMSENPAKVFDIDRRGEIREGYFADLTIVVPEEHRIEDSDVLSLCGWTPLDGCVLSHRVKCTFVNGQMVWDGENILNTKAAMPLHFERKAL